MATVRIGHASGDENGKIKNGAAGDQTGKEVCIRTWYNHGKGWVVLRCKDASKREKIAKAMELACANNDIGYDQWQRDTLFNNIKDKGFDPSKTTKKCETDCSALVRVCIAYAYGKDVVGNIRTVTEPAALVNSGEFTKLTDKKYTESTDYLLRGDIICTKTSGHTAVVLDNGAKVAASSSGSSAATTKAVKATEAAKSYQESLGGTYKVTCNILNVRHGAGASKPKMTTIGKTEKITEVNCFGYYTTVLGRKWLYIKFTKGGVVYTGFASSKYLKKV